jgi:hypothetical protein
MIALTLASFLGICVFYGVAQAATAGLVADNAHESHGCFADQGASDRKADRPGREVESVPVHEEVGAR